MMERKKSEVAVTVLQKDGHFGARQSPLNY